MEDDDSNIPKLAGRKNAGRSRITNGSALLPMTDGRSATARRYRDLYVQICDDLSGAENLSTLQQQLARRAAMLCAEAERQEALAANGDPAFSITEYAPLCDRLGRLADRLGLLRIAKVVDDDPFALLNQISAKIIAEREPSND